MHLFHGEPELADEWIRGSKVRGRISKTLLRQVSNVKRLFEKTCAGQVSTQKEARWVE